jgi:hypothetical protein
LKKNEATGLDWNLVNDSAHGIEAPPSDDEESPESYIGYRQAERFSSMERLVHDKQRVYSPPAVLLLNHWGLSGSWNVNAESAVSQESSGRIVFRFHSRDLHLVMAPTKAAVRSYDWTFDIRQDCSASANAAACTCERSSSTERGLRCCGSSGIERRSEPGSMHSMPGLPKMLLWSRWQTSSRGSHGLCCRAGRTTGQWGILLPHEIVRKRRLWLGSADALPLSRTTTTTD